MRFGTVSVPNSQRTLPIDWPRLLCRLIMHTRGTGSVSGPQRKPRGTVQALGLSDASRPTASASADGFTLYAPDHPVESRAENGLDVVISEDLEEEIRFGQATQLLHFHFILLGSSSPPVLAGSGGLKLAPGPTETHLCPAQTGLLEHREVIVAFVQEHFISDGGFPVRGELIASQEEDAEELNACLLAMVQF